MNLYFILQKLLNRLDDHKFVETWERRYLNRLTTVISILGIIFLVVIVFIGSMINAMSGFFAALLAMMLFGPILGYYMVVHFIKFLAINNDRYVQIKMGHTNNNINYDNVIN